MFLDLIKVSERQLIDMTGKPSVIKVGSTQRIKERFDEYKRIGYSGQMYYAMTKNMRNFEDRCLLSAKLSGGANYNFYDDSISPAIEGYVYLIQGKWL
jgi:hypothetical protein